MVERVGVGGLDRGDGMNHHQDIVQGGWFAMAASGIGAWIGWFFGGASPAVMLSTTIGLLIGAMKLWDYVQRKRRGKALDTQRGDL